MLSEDAGHPGPGGALEDERAGDDRDGAQAEQDHTPAGEADLVDVVADTAPDIVLRERGVGRSGDAGRAAVGGEPFTGGDTPLEAR
jgi:hypothetical protein